MKRGKARDTLKDSGLSDAGDSSREKGGTQKSLIVHSNDCKIQSRNVFNQAKVLAVISALGEEQTHD